MIAEPTATWHRDRFAEFVHLKARVGEPSPHIAVMAELCRALPSDDALWLAGCYLATYSAFTGPLLAMHTQSVMNPEHRQQWLREHWAGIQLRRPRRCVNTPEKLARCLHSWVDWTQQRSHWPDADAPYDHWWEAVNDGVWGFGRYISIRALELLRRLGWMDAELYDIRAIGGWSPVRALHLMYPEADLLHRKLESGAVDAVAATVLQAVRIATPQTGWYQLAACLCEYRVCWSKGGDYPGHQMDEELGYYTRYREVWNLADHPMLAARRALFPAWCLGELHNWTGVRKEAGMHLRLTGRNWSDDPTWQVAA